VVQQRGTGEKGKEAVLASCPWVDNTTDGFHTGIPNEIIVSGGGDGEDQDSSTQDQKPEGN
jgi:hypothetical protein